MKCPPSSSSTSVAWSRLEILAVSIDPLGAQVVAAVYAEPTLSFPTLLDPKTLVERLYQNYGVPESFIVDKRGISWKKWWGQRTGVTGNSWPSFERLLAMQRPTESARLL